MYPTNMILGNGEGYAVANCVADEAYYRALGYVVPGETPVQHPVPVAVEKYGVPDIADMTLPRSATLDGVRARLDELGIAYDKNCNYATLIKRLPKE